MSEPNGEITSASQAYLCRSNLRDLALRSQALEHDFYTGLAGTVEKASRDLTERFSKLMQDAIPDWSNQCFVDFCRETGVESDSMFTWRGDVGALRERESELSVAASRRSEAEKNRSKYSGWFGAKSGMEREYATANGNYEVALAEEKRLAALVKAASVKAGASGRTLLEELMHRAAQISGTRHCPGLREELRGVAERAELSLASFRSDQLAIARQMNAQVANLNKIYGG